MKKLICKGLALALTLTLILSTCILSGAMLVSAEDSYTVTTTTGSTSDTFDTSKNIIYGKIPTEFSSVTELTNGVNLARALTSAKTLSFDLDGYKKINQVIVTSQNQSDTATRLGKYEIYLSDSLDNLYDEANKIAEIDPEGVTAGWRTYIDTFNFSENDAKTGKYIGFNILERNITNATGIAYINQIEVVGVEYVPHYTITTTAGTTSDTYDTSKNLIYNKMSTTFPTAFGGFTDGLNSKVSVGSSSSSWPLKFTYELGSTYKIDKVAVTSDASNYGAGKLRLGEYSIYVSDSADDLYNEKNLIANVKGEVSNYGANQTVIDTIEFSETYDTTGAYIGFAIISATLDTATYGTAYVYELEVEGTENVPDYTVTTTSGSTSDAINTDSLIYGKAPIEFPEVTELTNGVNSQNSLSTIETLTFELDGTAKIEGVRVINQNNSDKVTRLGKYEIYVSDSLSDLYNAENKIAEIDPEEVTAGCRTYVDNFTFSDSYAKTGKYVGFNIVERNVLDPEGYTAINEIEVTGTKCNTVTATAGAGGSISPAGETFLTGEALAVTVTANDGFKVEEVLVNGKAAELTNGVYTFTGTETGWNTIEATFVLKGDANNDGNLDEADLTVIKKHILNIETADSKYADIDGDGDIDLLDLVTAYEIQQGVSPAVTA